MKEVQKRQVKLISSHCRQIHNTHILAVVDDLAMDDLEAQLRVWAMSSLGELHRVWRSNVIFFDGNFIAVLISSDISSTVRNMKLDYQYTELLIRHSIERRIK